MLDLLCALEDVEDLGVPGPLLEQSDLGIACGATDLDSLVGQLGNHAARLGLRHRRLGRVRLLVIGHPRGTDGKQPRSLPIGFEANEVVDSCCLIGGGLVVVDDVSGALEGCAQLLECGTSEADGHRRDQRTRVVEGLHDTRERLLGIDFR